MGARDRHLEADASSSSALDTTGTSRYEGTGHADSHRRCQTRCRVSCCGKITREDHFERVDQVNSRWSSNISCASVGRRPVELAMLSSRKQRLADARIADYRARLASSSAALIDPPVYDPTCSSTAMLARRAITAVSLQDSISRSLVSFGMLITGYVGGPRRHTSSLGAGCANLIAVAAHRTRHRIGAAATSPATGLEGLEHLEDPEATSFRTPKTTINSAPSRSDMFALSS